MPARDAGKKKPGKKYSQIQTLENHLSCIAGMALARTVWAFEFATFAETLQRVVCNYMAARHHHRWILVRGLFLGHRTNED